MSHTVKRWVLAVTLLVLMPVTIVCDLPAVDEIYDAFDIEVYDDDCRGHCHDDCWFDCDDEWSFDFDWWW
jgi:hypothetical protein